MLAILGRERTNAVNPPFIHKELYGRPDGNHRRSLMYRLKILAALLVLWPALTPTILLAAELYDSALHVHVVNVIRNNAADEFAVTLRVDPGYHINANPATFVYLIPTALKFAELQPLRIIYPASVQFRPKFANEEEIAVYQGTIVITALFPSGELGQTRILRATVTVQACTDVICLPPSELPVRTKPRE